MSDSAPPKDYCSICGNWVTEHPALSRADNKTEICPDCGIDQALEDYKKMRAEEKAKEQTQVKPTAQEMLDKVRRKDIDDWGV